MRRNAGFGVKYTRNPERSERVAGRPRLIVEQRFPVSGLTPYAVAGCRPLAMLGALISFSFTQGSAAVAAAPWAMIMPP